MDLDALPVEVLLKIFSYLPRYDIVSLVNKKFYAIVCKLAEPEICLKLTEKDLDNHELLRSIMNTTRQIRNISIECHSRTQSLTAIIAKFSESIIYLKLHGIYVRFKLSDWLEILSLIPNVIHLVFKHTNYLPTDKNKNKDNVVHSSSLINLYHLKTLEINCDNPYLMGLFNRLPADVLTQVTLEDLSNRQLTELNDLCKRQTTIKRLTLSTPRAGFIANIPICVNTDLLENMQLESLEWRVNSFQYSNSIFETILSKQTNLKSLHLKGKFVGDLMNIECQIWHQLATFSIDLTGFSDAAFENMRKLNNLKELTIRSDKDNMSRFCETFTAVNNSRLTTLNLYYFDAVSEHLVAALAKSVPNLKVARFYNVSTYHHIMESFNFVEVLQLGHSFYDSHNYSHGSTSTISINTKLTELTIVNTFVNITALLKTLIHNYPNLKKLVMRSTAPFTTTKLKMILQGFRKMESFTLFADEYDLNIDDLDLITEHGNNLRFVSLMCLKVSLTNEMEKKFSNRFDIVRCSDARLEMAVDKKTMKNEKIKNGD